MKIIKVSNVQAHCAKHGFTDHKEYVKADGTIVYKCLLCYRERPYNYPIYGRQSPEFKKPATDEHNEHQYGRYVA
jgi:hypothetical protein